MPAIYNRAKAIPASKEAWRYSNSRSLEPAKDSALCLALLLCWQPCPGSHRPGTFSWGLFPLHRLHVS